MYRNAFGLNTLYLTRLRLLASEADGQIQECFNLNIKTLPSCTCSIVIGIGAQTIF